MRIIPLLAVSFLLGACAMHNESFVNQEPIRLQNETIQADFVSSQISKSQLNDLASDIKRRGKGAVTVTVQYELKPPLKNSQRLAEAQGTRVTSYLKQQGVRRPLQVILEPVDLGQSNHMISVRYEAIKAMDPKDCLHIGNADADQYTQATDSHYRYGCTQDHYLSAMIAHPEDLLGNDSTSTTDSQRLAKSQDTYRSGEPATDPNQSTLSASQVYSSQ